MKSANPVVRRSHFGRLQEDLAGTLNELEDKLGTRITETEYRMRQSTRKAFQALEIRVFWLEMPWYRKLYVRLVLLFRRVKSWYANTFKGSDDESGADGGSTDSAAGGGEAGEDRESVRPGTGTGQASDEGRGAGGGAGPDDGSGGADPDVVDAGAAGALQ